MSTKSQKIKNILIAKRGHRCENCKYETWIGKPIALELHHIDGNCKNNDEKNLKLLCPNCHMLTENHSRKVNKHGKSTKKVSDDELLSVMAVSENIHQVLLAVNLDSRSGTNFSRVYFLAMRYGYTHLL